MACLSQPELVLGLKTQMGFRFEQISTLLLFYFQNPPSGVLQRKKSEHAEGRIAISQRYLSI